MGEITVIGIDLAKNTFSLCGMSKNGKVQWNKTFSAKKLVEFTAKHHPTLIAFEACGSCHHWARVFQRQGHKIKVMAVQRVKAFVSPHKKNDRADAEAIGRAALCESIPSVAVKGVEQQDIEILINYREKLIAERVALINQVHAMALEYGVRLKKSQSVGQIEDILLNLEDAENELTAVARDLIATTLSLVRTINKEIDGIDKKVAALLKPNQAYKNLLTVPGIGAMTAAAIIAHTGGQVNRFRNGRDFAAYLGLTPKQYSTGGKTRLGRITKAGHKTIRKFLFMGAFATLRVSQKRNDLLSTWLTRKKEAKGYRYASVALAHKNARIVFAILKTGEPYRYIENETDIVAA